MTLTPGTRLGPYEILSPLGAGGMGEVWKARDTRLDRFVAVKVLPEHLAKHPESLARFEREAKAVAALNHPNITGIFDIGNSDGVAYVAMELLEGESLRTRLESGPLPPRKATELAIQMAQGLAAAHEKGVVHRDLKPDNLWFTKEGRLKILDFGLAKQITTMGTNSDSLQPTAAISPGHHTEKGMLLGTIGYMSPEQVRGESVDARSDIFSFGVVLFEMLTGKRAFARDTAADTMAAILKEEPPELETSKPLPPGLRRVVDHCLEKAPAHRFHDAEDLAFSLENLSGGGSSGVDGFAPALVGAGDPWANRLRPLGLVMLVTITLGLAYLVGRVSAGRGPRNVSYKQLTLRQQTIHAARFAPDGRSIFFSAALKGTIPQLFTVRADFPDPKAISPPGVHLLSVSSKGELAVLTGARYLAHNLFNGTLARMPLEGGAPREVLEGIREADWTPDGAALAVIREVGGKDRLEFPIGKVLAETEGYLSDLRFSPSGDRIAFFEHSIRWDDQGNVAVVDLAGHKTVLSPVIWGVEGLVWTPNGKEVLYSGGGGYEDFAVTAVALSGRSRIALQSAGGITIRDTDRNGRWLVSNDWLEKEMLIRAPGQPVERNLGWLGSSQNSVLSADGKTVYFSEQNGSVGPFYALCMRGTDGSPVIRLGDGNPLDISPDGKAVLAAVPSSPPQLVIYPTGAGETRRLQAGGIVTFDAARFFPDGKALLVSGSEAGRPVRCYVQDLESGKPRAVTPEGTLNGIVSPDGNWILAGLSGAGLAVYPVAGGEGRVIPGTSAGDTGIRWSRDNRTVLVYREGELPINVRRLNPETGKGELVRILGPNDLGGVSSIQGAYLTADEQSHSYTLWKFSSHLFLAEGAQ